MNNDTYISEIIRQVSDIIRNKKISSSKMNEILQVSDDDKYRKHYFMFSSDAKQFCLDLINKKKYPLDITMKMCKMWFQMRKLQQSLKKLKLIQLIHYILLNLILSPLNSLSSNQAISKEQSIKILLRKKELTFPGFGANIIKHSENVLRW